MVSLTQPLSLGKLFVHPLVTKIFLLGKPKETIGEGVEEFYSDINEDWLQRNRKGEPTETQRQLELISQEAAKVEEEEKTKKKSKAQIKFEEECKANWKLLGKNLIGTMAVPINMLSLPKKITALRNLQAKIVTMEVGPRLWEQNVNAHDKPGIVCIFEVKSFKFRHITISIGHGRRKSQVD